MPSTPVTTSTSTSVHARAIGLRARYSHHGKTWVLGLDVDGTAIDLFLWGSPDEVWDALDRIIDAARATKIGILNAARTEPVTVDPDSACNPKLVEGPGERGLIRRCATHGLAAYLRDSTVCDAYLAAAERQGVRDNEERMRS